MQIHLQKILLLRFDSVRSRTRHFILHSETELCLFLIPFTVLRISSPTVYSDWRVAKGILRSATIGFVMVIQCMRCKSCDAMRCNAMWHCVRACVMRFRGYLFLGGCFRGLTAATISLQVIMRHCVHVCVPRNPTNCTEPPQQISQIVQCMLYFDTWSYFVF